MEWRQKVQETFNTLMQDTFKVLSVRNPWAWALVTKRPDGRPLKPVENRTTSLGKRNKGTWVLIHVGHSHRPDPKAIGMVEELSWYNGTAISMPHWAVTKYEKIGAIVGAVLFSDDLTPSAATNDPYARPWVTPPSAYTVDRRRCWMVKDCVAFEHHIPTKGTRAPLIWTPSAEVHELARTEMRRTVGGGV